MHELGITKNIISIVGEHAQGGQIKRVRLEIGKLSAILPDSLRFCFDVCSKGTVLEGADLEIIDMPGIFRCKECQKENEFDAFFGTCPCGSKNLECISGEELKIKEMEFA
ncbi:MAG: hydrogenase maturation nickel metallochaperone HypA [Nitrospinaceae bacterium]